MAGTQEAIDRAQVTAYRRSLEAHSEGSHLTTALENARATVQTLGTKALLGLDAGNVRAAISDAVYSIFADHPELRDGALNRILMDRGLEKGTVEYGAAWKAMQHGGMQKLNRGLIDQLTAETLAQLQPASAER